MENEAVRLKDFVKKYGNGDIDEYIILSEEFTYRCYENSVKMLVCIFDFLNDFLTEIENNEESLTLELKSIIAATGLLASTYTTHSNRNQVIDTVFSILENIVKTDIENYNGDVTELGDLLVDRLAGILTRNLTKEELDIITRKE